MLKRQGMPMFVAAVTAFIFLAGFSAAADDIKGRMLERLPVINALKEQGVVGENNQGLLEFRKQAKAHGELVVAENRDRRAVYRMIAERQKTKPELVAKQRAAQIAEKEPAGHWLQDPGGKWYRK